MPTMPNMPDEFTALLLSFAPLVSTRVWRHVPVLVMGAILVPGQRMISSILRIMGLAHVRSFQTYHRVLNRGVWSSLGASRILFGLLIASLAPEGPLVVGIDETIERRRGRKIAAAGIYRDPVRSSHSHFVKVRGLRWMSMMLLAPIPWAGRVWALPFLTVLAPSERSATRLRRRFKPLTSWARQKMILQAHRWAPERPLVVVGDRTYAALELLDAVRRQVTLVTRLRLDARLFAPPPQRLPPPAGTSTPGRRTAFLPDCAGSGSSGHLDTADACALVWRAESLTRVPVADRRLVFDGSPSSAHSLGHPP